MQSPAWFEGIATGVQTMDTEHRVQVSLINAFEVLIRDKDKGGFAEKTIAQLADFTSMHFLSEELLMRRRDYPQLEAHKAEHTRLLKRIDELRKNLGSGEGDAVLATVDELRRWLVEHIKSMDQAFVDWCEAQPGM